MYARPFNGNYKEIHHLLLSKNEYGVFEVAIVMNSGVKYNYMLKMGHHLETDIFDGLIRYRVKKMTLTYGTGDWTFVKQEIEKLLKHCELSN